MLAVARGSVNPVIARLGGGGSYDIGRSLVISGFPRSGTTWLAELLATLPGAGILFEPLNPIRVRAAKRAGCDWQNFRTEDEEWPEGERFLGEVLHGRPLTPWTTTNLPIRRAWRVTRWVVKLVNSNAMLPWLVTHFSVPPPILLIRHPCAVYASWLRRGWPIPAHPPFEGSRFYDEYPQFVPVVKSLVAPEEYFAALWCVDHYHVLNRLGPAQYQLCYYERLVAEGTREVRRLLDRWGLVPPDRLEAAVRRPSAKASRDLRTASKSQLGGWQRYVPRPVIERMIAVLRRFGIEVYGPRPEPEGSDVKNER